MGLFAFGDRFEFLVDLRQLGLVQPQLGDELADCMIETLR